MAFPFQATREIFEYSGARDVRKASFEDVKSAVGSKSGVDKTSKKPVSQALFFDVRSLEYLDKVTGLGVLTVLSDRLFRLYSDTLAIVQALPEI